MDNYNTEIKHITCSLCSQRMLRTSFKRHLKTKKHALNVAKEKKFMNCTTCDKKVLKRNFNRHCKSKDHIHKSSKYPNEILKIIRGYSGYYMDKYIKDAHIRERKFLELDAELDNLPLGKEFFETIKVIYDVEQFVRIVVRLLMFWENEGMNDNTTIHDYSYEMCMKYMEIIKFIVESWLYHEISESFTCALETDIYDPNLNDIIDGYY